MREIYYGLKSTVNEDNSAMFFLLTPYHLKGKWFSLATDYKDFFLLQSFLTDIIFMIIYRLLVAMLDDNNHNF